jgi:signal transduction histidine kinase
VATRLVGVVRGWPIRIRLAAALTAVMALVLLGVAMASLAHMRASLDDSINKSLAYRLRDLRPEVSVLARDLLGVARPHGDHDGNPADRVVGATALCPLLCSIKARYRAAVGEHAIILDCAPDLAVAASAEDIDRAVSNLLDNAREHGAPPVIIKVCPAAMTTAETPASAPRGSAGEATVVIEVRDHGPGFDPGFLPHAFQRFTVADPACTEGGGTGRGLAIVAALAGRNGGRVTATNCPDGGASVVLILPAAPTPAPASAPT